MEGERFFSPLNFLRALMAAEANEAGAPSFPGLDQDDLQRIVLDEMFGAAWRVLDAQPGSWQVELEEFGEGVDGVTISYRADGCVRGVTVATSSPRLTDRSPQLHPTPT